MKRTLVLTLLLVIALGGCTARITDFTIISTKNHRVNVPANAKGFRVTGEDLNYYVLFIPFGFPSIKTAIDRAIENSGPGYDALIDGVVNNYMLFFGVGFHYGYKVEGTPINTSELRAALLREGKSPDLVMDDMNILYHSSLAKSNDVAIANLTVESH